MYQIEVKNASRKSEIYFQKKTMSEKLKSKTTTCKAWQYRTYVL